MTLLTVGSARINLVKSTVTMIYSTDYGLFDLSACNKAVYENNLQVYKVQTKGSE